MKGLLAAVLLLSSVLLGATPVVTSLTDQVTPRFETHNIAGAVAGFATAQVTLGRHSVELFIPSGKIGQVFNLGLNAEVPARGKGKGEGLVLFDGVSFKAKPGLEGVNGPLYVSIILFDEDNDFGVSMLHYTPVWTGPDSAGWYTVTVPPGALWDAWTFDGRPWPASADPGYISLADWEEYLDDLDMDAEVRKLNIQFGYGWHAWGRVFVDGLSFGGRTLDFEP